MFLFVLTWLGNSNEPVDVKQTYSTFILTNKTNSVDKKSQKKKHVSFHEVLSLIINENKDKDRKWIKGNAKDRYKSYCSQQKAELIELTNYDMSLSSKNIPKVRKYRGFTYYSLWVISDISQKGNLISPKTRIPQVPKSK